MLKLVRKELAAGKRVPPYLICHDSQLVDVSSRRPKSKQELAEINGFGRTKVERYGQAIISAIQGFEDQPLETSSLSSTADRSLKLLRQGLSVAAVADQRSLEPSTIYDHLASAIEAGLLEAREALPIDEEEIDEILAAFEDTNTLETGKLGPAHAALDGRYEYGLLQCVLAELA